MKKKKTFGRREFVKKAAQAAAAVAVCKGMTPAAARAETDGTIPTCTLGKTGLKLPILGYGGAALPAKWRNPLSHEDRVALVRHAYDRGIRYFDTAGNYMESQAILGEALKGIRDNVILVTKVETTDPSLVRGAVEKSLRELQTDRLDAILIHGSPGLEQMTVEQAMKIHAELVKLRGEKIARFIGFSAHGHFDKALALINSGGFDLCMLSCGYIPLGYKRLFSAQTVALRDTCLSKAHELGMGIVAMKVIGAGALGAWSGYHVPEFDKQRLRQLPAAAIRFVLQDKRIHLLDIGMRRKEEIEANITILSGDAAYTTENGTLLAEFSAKLYETEAYKQMRIE
ncbi:MAG: aldo/keto reductase [Planctomycetota bacterium]